MRSGNGIEPPKNGDGRAIWDRLDVLEKRMYQLVVGFAFALGGLAIEIALTG